MKEITLQEITGFGINIFTRNFDGLSATKKTAHYFSSPTFCIYRHEVIATKDLSLSCAIYFRGKEALKFFQEHCRLEPYYNENSNKGYAITSIAVKKDDKFFACS